MTITRHNGGRSFAVHDEQGALVCVCLYKKGAQEVVRRLTLPAGSAPAAQPPEPGPPSEAAGGVRRSGSASP